MLLLGLVIRTGGLTNKGKLMRNVLLPNASLIKYDKQMPLVYKILMLYGLCCILVQVYFLSFRVSTIFYAMSTVSQVTPIWIGVILRVAHNVACERLSKENSVICLNPARLVMCGKVRVFCFDKTGTITYEGMQFAGILPLDLKKSTSQSTVQFVPQLLHKHECTHVLRTNIRQTGLPSDTFLRLGLKALVFCHSLEPKNTQITHKIYCEDNNRVADRNGAAQKSGAAQNEADIECVEYDGSQLEKAMFEGMGWRVGYEGDKKVLYPPPLCRSPIFEYIKTFPFDHARKSMCVLVRTRWGPQLMVGGGEDEVWEKEVSLKSAEVFDKPEIYTYCKGSPTRIEELCVRSSLPIDFEETVKTLATGGFYVLGVAYRPVTSIELEEFAEGDFHRDMLEAPNTFIFLGLIVFSNELKADARETMLALKKGGVRPVIITGDNVYAAVYAAKECGILQPSRVQKYKQDMFFQRQKTIQSQIYKSLHGILSRPMSHSLPTSRNLLKQFPTNGFNNSAYSVSTPNSGYFVNTVTSNPTVSDSNVLRSNHTATSRINDGCERLGYQNEGDSYDLNCVGNNWEDFCSQLPFSRVQSNLRMSEALCKEASTILGSGAQIGSPQLQAEGLLSNPFSETLPDQFSVVYCRMERVRYCPLSLSPWGEETSSVPNQLEENDANNCDTPKSNHSTPAMANFQCYDSPDPIDRRRTQTIITEPFGKPKLFQRAHSADPEPRQKNRTKKKFAPQNNQTASPNNLLTQQPILTNQNFPPQSTEDVLCTYELVWRELKTDALVETSRIYYGGEFEDLCVSSDALPFLSETLVEDPSEQLGVDILEARGLLASDFAPRKISLLQLLLPKIRIFAACKPNDKVAIVKQYMASNFVTAMCGDGGNDCGALQAADVAIAFSQSEASVVSAFTSRNEALGGVLEVVKEGRSCLTTSLSCYKFMVTYGMLLSFAKLSLYAASSSLLSESAHILIDNVMLLGLSRAMTLSRPRDRLKVRTPTSSLLGPQTVISVTLMMAINAIFLFVLFCQLRSIGIESSKSYIESFPLHAWWLRTDSMEAASCFIWVGFQLVNGAFVFSFGGAFRRGVFANLPLTAIWASLNLLLIFLVLSPPCLLTCAFRVNCTDTKTLVVPFLSRLSPSFSGLPLHTQTHSNVFPLIWKVKLLAINLLNILANVFVAKHNAYWAAYLRDKKWTGNADIAV